MQQGQHHNLGIGGLAIAMIVDLMFALNVIAGKEVVDASAPLTAVALRMGVVLILCLPAFRLVPGRTGTLALYGFLNGGMFLLLMNIALFMATNVGALAIAGQLSVPFSLLLGALLLGEHLSRMKLIGVVLAFLGVATLAFDPEMLTEILAVVMMALAALSWGAGTLVQRKLGGIGLMTIQSWNGLMAAAVLAPFALWFEPEALYKIAHANHVVIGWFAFSTVGATIAGQGALAWLLQRYPISTIMPLMLASPVMATGLASLYFHTPITIGMIGGGGLALVGVAIIAFARAKGVPGEAV
jgi:O-acetylserine/cysteine efflux transporter